MKIPQNELSAYANAVSKEIFNKPLNKLVQTEANTLMISFISRERCGEIDNDTYQQVNAYVKNINFPDPRKAKPRQKKEASE